MDNIHYDTKNEGNNKKANDVNNSRSRNTSKTSNTLQSTRQESNSNHDSNKVTRKRITIMRIRLGIKQP